MIAGGQPSRPAANEIERDVQSLVVLRIRRDIGLRSGLLVPFRLQVTAQRSLADRISEAFDLLRHFLKNFNIRRDTLGLD